MTSRGARGWWSVAILVAAAFALLAPRDARAQPPSAELLDRLAAHAAAYEAMRTRASYTIDGRMERLDGDGRPDAVKELRARVIGDGARARFEVIAYREDGEDKTADAQRKARDREAEKKDPKDEHPIRMPFLARERPKYTFAQVEVDRADPARVRIAFVPRVRDEDAIEGSAWVDTRAGTVISAGFKLVATSFFVDYVHVTIELGAPTPLGPAVSKVTLEGKGGILFFRKRFRAEATLSDYRIAPARE